MYDSIVHDEMLIFVFLGQCKTRHSHLVRLSLLPKVQILWGCYELLLLPIANVMVWQAHTSNVSCFLTQG